MVILFRFRPSIGLPEQYLHVGNRWMLWPEIDRHMRVTKETPEQTYVRWVKEAKTTGNEYRIVNAYRLMGLDGQVIREDVLEPLA